MNNEEKKFPDGITYKIYSGGQYMVRVKEWNGRTFYNVTLQQKQYDGTILTFSRQLKFIDCEPPKDGDTITILNGFESDYMSTKDKYNPVVVICVTKYTKAEQNESAFSEYNERVGDVGDIEIKDEDFPF